MSTEATSIDLDDLCGRRDEILDMRANVRQGSAALEAICAVQRYTLDERDAFLPIQRLGRCYRSIGVIGQAVKGISGPETIA
jgi:hypothetical protein